MGLIYNFVWLGLSRMLQNIVVLMACKSFFHLHKCSAPSQSKATTLNEWFSTREVYLIRETGVIFAEKKKKKGHWQRSSIANFTVITQSQNSIQMIHLTKAEYLLQWLLYAVCIFVYAFFLFRTFQYASVYFFFFSF